MMMVSFADDQIKDNDDEAVPERGGTGTIKIVTEPAGSIVYLDGELLGKAPIEKSFRSGRFNLVVMDQGQELINTRFNVFPNKLNEYNTKTVMPYGNIEVTTNPPKCRIALDEDDADKTDGGKLTLKHIRVGNHMVKATCGKQSKQEMVQVVGESTVKVTLDFTKK